MDKFWVLQNSNPTIDLLNKINKCAKSIATYNFPTLYTKPPHDKLVDKLPSINGFALILHLNIKKWESIYGKEN